jgi:Protein of unknown function (DUF3011)
MRVCSFVVVTSVLAAQLASTPAWSQMTTMPVPSPTTKPAPVTPPTTKPAPVVRPVPLPGPVTELPRPVRPVIQPPRPQPAIQPPRPQPGYGGNFAGSINCRSSGNRERTCRANTENRVAVARIFAGRCRMTRDWSYSAYDIRVRNGCSAQFSYGYASGYPTPLPQPVPERDRGPSAGAVIAGVVVAGGLIALLASANRKKQAASAETTSPTPFPPGPPATVTADLSSMQSAARPTMQNCLFAAAKEIGVTGGSRMRLDRVTKIEPGNGGLRFNADLTSTYPDGDRATPIYCRATPTKIVQLDFGE